MSAGKINYKQINNGRRGRIAPIDRPYKLSVTLYGRQCDARYARLGPHD